MTAFTRQPDDILPVPHVGDRHPGGAGPTVGGQAQTPPGGLPVTADDEEGQTMDRNEAPSFTARTSEVRPRTGWTYTQAHEGLTWDEAVAIVQGRPFCAIEHPQGGFAAMTDATGYLHIIGADEAAPEGLKAVGA